jgi:hypothetical protein
MKMNLDLGKPGPEFGPAEINRTEPYYPSFHYEGKEPLDLPKSGVMTIRFRKSGSSESEGRNGDEHYSCTVDVLEIVSVEGSEPKKSASKQTEEALDGLRAGREKAQEDEG